MTTVISTSRLLNTFLDLARIPSLSGAEDEVASAITAKLQALAMSVERDQAGNLLARLAGQGEPLLLTAHMDTVGPCETVIPVVGDGVITSDGSTILGADDKSGVAIILEVLQVLIEQSLPHRPIEALFTVREEVGLAGAKAVDIGSLRARTGIGLDAGGHTGMIVTSAPSQNALWAQVHGRAAHAGAHPEDGINAIRVAAEAIVAMPLGRIDEETTANIGIISGGTATNVVPDLVTLRGEARSRSQTKIEVQTRAMVQALKGAAKAAGATVEVRVTPMYAAYTFGENTPAVRLVSEAMRSLGIEPLLVPTGGGSDANVFNAAGMEVVQITAGMQDVHTRKERIALEDMVTAAEVVLACVRPGR